MCGEKRTSDEQFLREMLLEKIECPVYFMLYRNKEGKMAPSMADQGFEKPATLKHNRRGSWPILKKEKNASKALFFAY